MWRRYGELNWKPLIDLLRRPYWKRLWIIQELAMNHQDTIFICGNRAFFREELREALALCKRESLMIQQWLRTSNYSITEEQVNLFGFFRRILSLVYLSSQREGESAMEEVLSLAQEGSSKDMRDRIYGILGLLPTALASRIKPDYGSSIETVFENFSENFLQVCGLENLWSWSGSELDLPSWCVNLSRPLHRCHIQWLRRRNASSNREFSHLLRHISGVQHLICKGIVLDTIASVTEHCISFSDVKGNGMIQHDPEAFYETIHWWRTQPSENYSMTHFSWAIPVNPGTFHHFLPRLGSKIIGEMMLAMT